MVLACYLPLQLSTAVAVTSNVEIAVNVTVVEPTCQIPAGEETIPLEFDTIDVKDLYSGATTPVKPFNIHLVCEGLEESKTVTATFSGNESEGLPGYLGLDSGSSASGVAIELLSNEDHLALNDTSKPYTLDAEDNELQFGARLIAKPAAISNKTISTGEYSATATFSLDYP